MIAGIFAHHGVWTGPVRPADAFNPRGYFENEELKVFSKDVLGPDIFNPNPVDETVRLRLQKLIGGQGYGSGPWLMKLGAHGHSLLSAFAPRFICVRRPVKSVLASYQRCGWLHARMNNDEVIRIIEEGRDIMDSIDGIDVDSDAVVSGVYRSLRDAFDYCDLAFDKTVADSFIDKTLWHPV